MFVIRILAVSVGCCLLSFISLAFHFRRQLIEYVQDFNRYPVDWPVWVYRLRRWWRLEGKPAMIPVTLMLIGLWAFLQLFYWLDANGFNNY